MTETRESRWRRRWLRSETGSGEAKSRTEAHEPRLRRRWLYPETEYIEYRLVRHGGARRCLRPGTGSD